MRLLHLVAQGVCEPDERRGQGVNCRGAQKYLGGKLYCIAGTQDLS